MTALALPPIANAQQFGTPPPRIKPERPAVSTLLSPADERRLREGLRLADRGEWDEVRTIANRLNDPTAARILLWRAAQSDYTASFDELNEALSELSDWPRMRTIREQAELRINQSDLSWDQRVEWFQRYPAVSGEGRIVHAEALLQTGQTQDGEALLRETWQGWILPRSYQMETARRFRSRLRPEDHIARVDYLMWRGYRNTAWALRDYLPSGHRRLTLARYRLLARSRGVDTAIAAVPRTLMDHPGLLYGRALWRRKSGNRDGALEQLIQIDSEGLSATAADVIWTERRIHVGYALKRGDYTTAYELASQHGLTSGGDFADAEWMAGWLALRKLDDASTALRHFTILEANVTRPISRGRALYWLGRAEEALGNTERATSHYRAAAEHPTVFYGQLAIERLGENVGDYLLPPGATPTPEERLAFHSKDLPRALMMLAEMDQPYFFRVMAYHLDDTLTAPVDVYLLAEISRDYGERGIATRGGKAGMLNGVFETETAYPLIDLPQLMPHAPEPAFLLAIMRQESELDPRAISRANARGMMQLLPSTALRTARSIDEGYRRNWLTDDEEYNILIGSSHLGDLVNGFDGSYIMAAAAYNAGARRPRQWIEDYGDPRTGEIDPVDWIESIPFGETRNYVQRVLEATQVYRARLDDGVIRVELAGDLARGG